MHGKPGQPQHSFHAFSMHIKTKFAVFQITPKNKKYVEKNTVTTKTDEKNLNKVDIIVANKVINT